MEREVYKIVTSNYTIQIPNEIESLPMWARHETIYNCEVRDTHTRSLFSLKRIHCYNYVFRNKVANIFFYLAKVIAPTEQIQ